MFDFSFSQLVLVCVVGLLVLGPQRLPIAIKTVAGWIKALRAFSSSVQLELTKELKLHELRESLRKAEENGLQNMTPEIKASIEELKRVTAAMQDSFQKEIASVIKSTDIGVKPPLDSNDKTEKPS